MIVRRATSADHPALVDLLRTVMAWPAGEIGDRLWRWKHVENPFGESAAWLAEDGERPIGVRLFLRWEFERNATIVPAVRAVDTATHPDHRGKGVFSTLTRTAVRALRDEGVSLVFNTPNKQSLPGYLKLGWTTVGRLPVAVRPASPRGFVRMVRSRVPARRESLDTTVGVPVTDVLDAVELAASLGCQPATDRFRTRRTPAYLRWRYGEAWLKYRAVLRTTDAADGVAIFRLRRRGRSVECAVVDMVAAPPHGRNTRELLRLAAQRSRADYAVVLGHAQRRGWMTAPGIGPLFTCLPLDDGPAPLLGDWALTLGDIELF